MAKLMTSSKLVRGYLKYEHVLQKKTFSKALKHTPRIPVPHQTQPKNNRLPYRFKY